MSKSKKKYQTETVQSSSVETSEVTTTEVVEELIEETESIKALRAIADTYADVESVQFKVADDEQSANVLMRHTNRTHTMLMALRTAAGEWIGARAVLIAAGDEPVFDKPSSCKPEQSA